MTGLEETRAGLLRVERLNLTLSAGAVAASLAFSSTLFAGSLAAGAALEVVNFRTLHGAARRFFAGELGGPGLWLGVVGLRLGLLGAALVFALTAGLEPIPLVIGLSLVMPAVVIDAWRNRPEVVPQPDYPVPPPDDPAWDRFSVWRFSAMDEQPEDDTAAAAQAATETPAAIATASVMEKGQK
jgi:hypothetical protein